MEDQDSSSGNGQWTREVFDDLLTGIFSDGGWFKQHRAFIKRWGLEAAGILCYFINYHERMKQSPGYRWDGGWFFCTIDRMKDELNVNHHAQERGIAKLKADGVLEAKVKGLPPRRYFRVNAEKLLMIIAEWKNECEKKDDTKPQTQPAPATPLFSDPGKIDVPDGSLLVRSNLVRTPLSAKAERRGRPAGRRTPDLLSSPVDDEVAGEVFLVLEAAGSDLVVNTPKRRAVKRSTLAASVTKLRTERGVGEQELREMVAWLKDHYADEYTPKMNKADDLFARWEKFRNAKQRQEADAGVEHEVPQSDRSKKLDRLRSRVCQVIESRGGNPATDRHTRMDLLVAMEELGLPENFLNGKSLWEE